MSVLALIIHNAVKFIQELSGRKILEVSIRYKTSSLISNTSHIYLCFSVLHWKYRIVSYNHELFFFIFITIKACRLHECNHV